MRHQILDILLIILLSVLIYFGNTSLLSTSLLILTLITLLNKNYYSILTIIPLFFINELLFFAFIILYTSIMYLNKVMSKDVYKNLSVYLITIIFFAFEYFVNNVPLDLVKYTLIITTLIFVINYLKTTYSKQIKLELLILSLTIINLPIMPAYLFFALYAGILVIELVSYEPTLYIFTAFLITIYALAVSSNIAFIIVQFMAYLGFISKKILSVKKHPDNLLFILEDINTNISNFCVFLNDFSKTTANIDYDKRVSDAVKILIENHCVVCKNRVDCYGNKKIKTYHYIKELLTNKNQINSSKKSGDFFDCKYYFSMSEKAVSLQKQYNLTNDSISEDLKILGICSSIQNYFISVFEKITPKMVRLLNLKKVLLDENYIFNNFDYSITNENEFYFKIFTNKNYYLLSIQDFVQSYFKKDDIDIILKNDHIHIHPKKYFTISYDSATLSLNNCQISGDNMLFKTINDINFICALSDGMGSGYLAYQLSQETLKMVDSITNCNIPFDSSLQILNNFYKTKEHSDSYATLDLININLNSGILSLYKLGSSTTYISRKNKIFPIYNNNLPFGINDLITNETYSIQDDDLIILVSDGINDYIDETVLINFIDNIKNESPHKIVYEILQKIYYENGNQIKDDTSCIALKVKKKDY